MKQSKSQAKAPRDLRWRLLEDLCAARSDWGLKDRSLQVLRALLSFLPKGERVHFVVFPSNRTLSDRLMGMPEATLRRHLASLRNAGLILRRPSPNGKRYRIGNAPDLTFGLDLSPFFALAQTIRETAEAAAARQTRLRALRARIQYRLSMLEADDPRRADIPRQLRRKLDEAALTRLLESLLETEDLPLKETVTAAQNDCYIQHEDKEDLTIQTAQIACSEIEDTSGLIIRDTAEMESAGTKAALFLGVHTAWQIAKHRNGVGWATLALAYLNRRLDHLVDPNRYLIALTNKAKDGKFDVIQALAQTAPVQS